MNKYILIDWSKPPKNFPYGLEPKAIELTAHEAHQLNYAMALNGKTTRYIKVEDV